MEKQSLVIILFSMLISMVGTTKNAQAQTKRTIHVSIAGTLPNYISESEKYQIEDLTLTGELNSTDFRLLREMAGCNYLGEKTNCKLKRLDLYDTKIVAGGEKYLDTEHIRGNNLYNSGQFRYEITSSDIFPVYAFFGCQTLEAIVLPTSVTSIGKFCFRFCCGLISVNIPNNVESIGDSAFGYCENLPSVTIPQGVTEICEWAFDDCYSLVSIIIPNSVTTIGDNAFGSTPWFNNQSDGLVYAGKVLYRYKGEMPVNTTVTINEGTLGIADSAFSYDSSALTSVTIPNSVTSIGGMAFRGCNDLTTIVSEIEKPFEININTFSSETYTFAELIVPKGTKAAYQATEGWNKFTKITESTSSEEPTPTDYSKQPFTIVAHNEDVNVRMVASSSEVFEDVQFSTDKGQTWSAPGNTDLFFKTIPANTTLSLRGAFLRYLSSLEISGGKFDVEGNIFSIDANYEAKDKWKTCTDAINLNGLFSGHTNLISAENLILPATTLADWCYYHMFDGCTSLTTAPALPATTLANQCYAGMFKGCTSLTIAPALPATTLAGSCYYHMFDGCTSLATAPALPATTLANQCYAGMFKGCTSLTIAPALPATVLTNSCYYSMFYGCLTLTTAPELPATILANDCYRFMFEGCKSLITAPVLPAATLADYCYYMMFYGCTSLNYVKCLATDISPKVTHNWLYGVSSSGKFVKASSMNNWSRDASGIPEGWTIQNDEESSTSDFSNDGLTYIVDTPSLTAEVTSYDQSKSSVTIPETVSFDGRTYRVTSIGKFAFYQCRNVLSVTIPNSVTSIGSSAFEDCSALTSVSLGGGLSSIGGSAFEDCTSLLAITIPVSVTSIALNAFKNCSNLKNVTSEILTPFAIQDNVFEGIASDATLTVPKGTKSAYQSTVGWNKFTKIMETTSGIEDPATQYFTFVAKENGTFRFSGTSSDKVDNSVIYYSLDSGASWTVLARNVQSPTIQAGKRIMFKGTLTPLYYEVNNGEAIVGIGGFSSTGRFDVEGNIMSLLFGDNFIGKTNLTGKDHTFYELFLDCTGLINASNLVLPATTLADNCYEGMFRNCTSLTIAPQLPATKLPKCCYEGMFYNCTSLTTAPQLQATSLEISCYSHMFGFCTSLTIAPKLPAVALAEKCYRSMFRGCISLTKAPQLPATTLTSQCYEYMFAGCASLKEITCLATNISASDCTGNWLSDVASTGTFTKSSSMNSWPRGVNGIPTNWTIQNDNGSSTNEITINSISYVVDNSTLTAEVKSVDNSLRSVNIPESINYNGTEYRVTSLAERSFEGRDDITYLSIPSSITSIGEYAFLDCGSNIMVNIESLEAWCKVKFANKHSCPLSCAKSFCLNDVEVKSLSIPSGVTSISSYAFYQCRSISSLSIPSSVTSISSSVFEDCTGLISVSLGNGLTSIGGSAFEDCTSLSAITLPATVTSIALNAFRNCSNLKNVSSEIQTPFAIQDNVFEGIASGATLTVPKGTKSAYQSTAGWNKFTKITESTNGGDGLKVELEALSYSREYGEENPVFDYRINAEEGEQFLWKGSETYGESWSLRNIDVTTGIEMFNSGDRLRFYATNIGVNAWITVVIDDTKPYLVDGTFTTDGSSYLEVVLDEEKANQLNSHVSGGKITFQIQGRGFTLESISRSMSFELKGEPTISCEATVSSPVGTYPIKISKGSITNDNVTYVDGTLTITKAPLTITAKNCSKEQGQENPFFEVTYSGFKNGENESVLTRKPTISTTATASSGPGTYDINVSGAEAQNYSLTYNKGVLTVTEKDEVAFTIDGTTYQGSKSEKTVMVKSVDTSRTWMEIPASVNYDGTAYQVTGIDDDALKGSSMAALIWNVEAALTNNIFSNSSIGSNFMLYVKTASYAPSSVKNVVVDGTALSVLLSDDGGPFYCPQAFTARSISYTHNYSMETDIGKAKGWETLTLPFDVQNISHNTRGEIVPFPSYNSSSTQKPFWLANFSGSGFRRTAAVLANEPYIIAMPNSSSYRNEYNLAGDVTFSADNVQVPKTPSFSGTFVPAFGTVPKSSTVYALNVNNRHVKYSGNYDAGSRFIANLRDVRPFEAYISNSSTRGIIEINFDDGTTDMFDILLPTDENQEVTIHTLSGQQITRITQRDFETIWQQLPKGVYIVNGKKWIK